MVPWHGCGRRTAAPAPGRRTPAPSLSTATLTASSPGAENGKTVAGGGNPKARGCAVASLFLLIQNGGGWPAGVKRVLSAQPCRRAPASAGRQEVSSVTAPPPIPATRQTAKAAAPVPPGKPPAWPTDR